MSYPKHPLAVPAPHAATIEESLALLETNQATGLAVAEVRSRQRQYGANEVIEDTANKRLAMIVRQFTSPLIFILLLAVAATVVLREWFDASIILLAILVNAALGYYQENRAENALQHLRSFITVRTRVLRAGVEREVDARDIVPGDIVHLTTGSRVPADGRLIEVQDLRVDEAVLTGESLPVEKTIMRLAHDTVLPDRTNCVFGGTLVAQGRALMVVTAVGMHTEFGKIADLVGGTEREKTPLQKAVTQLAWVITVVISALVAVVFALGVYRGEAVLDMFLVSIAVAVGAIPEALPIGLTAVLAVGVERLAKRKGIMRNLTAAETLGSTTVIMTDKTGTLTEAKLQLVDVLDMTHLEQGVDSSVHHSEQSRYSQAQKELLTLALAGSDVVIENPGSPTADWRISGSPLEATIVRSAAHHGMAVTLLRERQARRTQVLFSSVYKFSVTTANLSLHGPLAVTVGEATQVVMGAPDILLERSALTKDAYLALQAEIKKHSEAGKRMIGLALVQADAPLVATAEEVTNLQFVGLLAFFDPVRTEVPAAIKRIEAYGARVIMATGDLPGTAVAVARDLGWEVKPSEVITGAALKNLDDAELRVALKTLKVCARVTPIDKLRIAQLLQQQGEIVAMTGDGVNDAPSLKAVNIGIAVGSGSDVAKGVSDLVLLDDNFNTIVAAIEEGKRVLGNIRKTFVYLMSSSLDEVILIGGSLLVGVALPLSAIQIIWVNFFTSSLPSIAFAFDTAIDKNPHTRNQHESVINAQVKSLIVVVGTITSLLLFAMYYTLLKFGFDPATVRTFIFVSFATYILCIAYSFRSLNTAIVRYNPFTNRLLNVGVVLGLVMLMATVYIPFLQPIFSTVALSGWWLLGVVGWVLLTGVLVEFVKWYHYRT